MAVHPKPPAPLLSVQNLGRRATSENRWLLRNIDLEVNAGDSMALTGPTGSGKSLLLRSLALLDPIDHGLLRWRGEEIPASLIPEYRRQAVYVHQKPALTRGTVGDNLRLPFQLVAGQGTSFPEERCRRLLADVGRQDSFLELSISHLSGGEAQTAALLRALLVEPAVLLLDEPTAALDPDATESVERLVLRWQEGGEDRAYLWVSHDSAQAERVGQRRLFMDSGSLTEGAAR